MEKLPQVIALCGRKRVGKDTVANFICHGYGYKNVKFAEPLKSAVQALFGFTDHQIEEDKETIDPLWGISPRNAMQFIGCNIIQYEFQKLIPNIGREFFVKSLLHKYSNDKIVISDLRFVHEFKAIQKFDNAVVIKIIRPSVDDGDTHISETEIDEIEGHYTIENNGSIDDLLISVNNIISKLGKTV
jgi:dephospho-CoA kinase